MSYCVPEGAALPWLSALAALWALLLFGGFILGKPDAVSRRRMPAWTRLGSSLALVAAGWTWFGFAHDSAAGTYSLLIALGMTLGCVGDFCLAGIFRLKAPLLAGMAAFGLGHVTYGAAGILLALRLHALTTGAFWGALVFWLGVGAIGWFVAVRRGRQATGLHYAALGYALLLASLVGIFTGLAVQAPGMWLPTIGAVLFLISDLALAFEQFGGVKPGALGDFVWLTYGPAQLLIVYSVGVAFGLA